MKRSIARACASRGRGAASPDRVSARKLNFRVRSIHRERPEGGIALARPTSHSWRRGAGPSAWLGAVAGGRIDQLGAHLDDFDGAGRAELEVSLPRRSARHPAATAPAIRASPARCARECRAARSPRRRALRRTRWPRACRDACASASRRSAATGRQRRHHHHTDNDAQHDRERRAPPTGDNRRGQGKRRADDGPRTRG